MKLVTLAVFLLLLLVSGSYVHSQRNAPDPEFCTTVSYGWPFAWRIDNCECDGRGGQTEFPPQANFWNGGAVLLFSGMMLGALHLVLKRGVYLLGAGR